MLCRGYEADATLVAGCDIFILNNFPLWNKLSISIFFKAFIRANVANMLVWAAAFLALLLGHFDPNMREALRLLFNQQLLSNCTWIDTNVLLVLLRLLQTEWWVILEPSKSDYPQHKGTRVHVEDAWSFCQTSLTSSFVPLPWVQLLRAKGGGWGSKSRHGLMFQRECDESAALYICAPCLISTNRSSL